MSEFSVKLIVTRVDVLHKSSFTSGQVIDDGVIVANGERRAFVPWASVSYIELDDSEAKPRSGGSTGGAKSPRKSRKTSP